MEKNSNDPIASTSYASYTSDSNDIVLHQPIVSAEEFFYDNLNTPWKPLPTHNLEQSPCYPIINKIGEFYYCKLHPKEKGNIYLDTIEQHCKYKDPELHKAEIQRLLAEEVENRLER